MDNNKESNNVESAKEFNSFLGLFRVLGMFTLALVLFIIFVKPFRPGLACCVPAVLIAIAVLWAYISISRNKDHRFPKSEFDEDEERNRDIY